MSKSAELAALIRARAGDAPVRLGLITPLSENFCAGCNRIRPSRSQGCWLL